MPNVILFTDNPPRNLGTEDRPTYLRYQTRTAGAYAIASNLRRQGYSVLVIDHCASYTLAGVKKVIDDNSQDLLWVGLSTTFFMSNGKSLYEYQQRWTETTDLYFKDSLAAMHGDVMGLPSVTKFINSSRELIWGESELNLIARHCKQYDVPLLIGGGWVTSIVNGNLKNLDKNVHIVAGRGETVTTNITRALARDKTADIIVFANNDHYDNVDFKHNTYIWNESDQVDQDEWLPLEISRGCAFNCAYCTFDRKSTFDNYRNPASIREEILRNYELFGVTRYILMDDLYNDSKEKVRAMYDQVWSQLPFKPEWTSYMRLDLFWADPDSIQIIQASGARMGSFGIETLHNVAGRKVGKGLGKKRILETLERIKAVWKDDVLINAYFIAGLPSEPEESILETIAWSHNTNLIDTVQYSPLWITPPSHRAFVLDANDMSKDNEKYKISWQPDGTWLNDQGITFSRANELAKLGNTPLSYLGGFGDYPEYRRMGLEHQDIVYYKDHYTEYLERLGVESVAVVEKITAKVKRVLNIT
jgi:radical SAM superfamily enzyme YgiQ (UPF0313 family)